jgi:hypothetical protein
MPSREFILENVRTHATLYKYQRALREIVEVLGPDAVGACPDCNTSCQGLMVEAGEALAIAKEALREP